MTKMEERQKQAIIDSFYFRCKAYGIDVDKKILQDKLINYDRKSLDELLLNIMRGNRDTMTSSLQKLHLPINIQKNEIELKEEVKKALNLQDITEFGSLESNYFKFKDQEGNIIVVRNLGDDSKVLFNDILNNTNLVNNPNGKQNASDIFKFLKNKKFIEIPLTNSEQINQEKTNKYQQKVLNMLKEKIGNREIIISPDENLYIVKGPTSNDDIILKGIYENGHYNVKPLSQKTYGAKVDENASKEQTTSHIEVPNNIVAEIDSDIEITSIIEEGIDTNMPEDTIVRKVQEQMTKKQHQYSTLPNLASIIIAVIALKKTRKKGSSNSMSGRQKVLFNPNAPKVSSMEDALAA